LRTILVGLGDIAPKHIEVLKALNCKISGVVTRNYNKVLERATKFGINKVYRSISEISSDDCDFFTILTSPENNGEILRKILPFKKPVLVEKPIAFKSKEIDEIIELNKNYNCPVMVAMNRRFYSIFHNGLEYIDKKNKKVDSIVIEAPERFSDINSSKFSDVIRKNWMFCNSIHCIDLIRFFGGDVKKIEVNSVPSKHVYSAVGNCKKDAEFVYISNWKSPGSWSVTLYADEIKIIYNPLEKGIIFENKGKIEIHPSSEDSKFKPGFYGLWNHFIKNHIEKKLFNWPESDLADHKSSIQLVEEIYKVNN